MWKYRKTGSKEWETISDVTARVLIRESMIPYPDQVYIDLIIGRSCLVECDNGVLCWEAEDVEDTDGFNYSPVSDNADTVVYHTIHGKGDL